MLRWVGFLALAWAQLWVQDGYVPELPPIELVQLSGWYKELSWRGGTYRDSVGDFRVWAARVPWAEGQQWYPAEPVQLSEPLTQQKSPVQHLYRYRWQLHRSGERLRIWIEPPAYTYQPLSETMQPRQQGQTFATQSVLATGRWYKIATAREGIYQIGADVLRALGIDPNSVDPRNLRLYGQRGGLLPQRNNEPQPDDLVEIPVYFPGAADGRWDASDAAYFWADSPDSWYPLPALPSRPYFHLKNPYTDSCYYFLTFDFGPGSRIAPQAPPSGPLTPRAQGMWFFFYEPEQINILKSGRVWLSEPINSNQPTLSVRFSELPAMDSLYLRVQVAAASFSPSQMAVQWGGMSLGSIPIPALPGPYDNFQARWGSLSRILYNVPAAPTFSVSYSGGGQGYLDYVEGVGWFTLRWVGGQQVFYLPAGSDWSVSVQSTALPLVWDVTDALRPEVLSLNATGGGFTFAARGDTLRRFCAFELGAAYAVRPVGVVSNQNLHGLVNLSFVIATTSAQAGLAQRFCDLHPEAGPCAVVTLDQLYNEFSGGRPDICALRNFLRMLYLRAPSPAEQPKYLLIIGQASYNFREKGPTIFPTYQSRESFYPPGTYGSDDFFGFLDDNEGFWGEGPSAGNYDPRDRLVQTHLLDLSITRLPTYSLADLEQYLAKLTDYLQNPAARGPWFQKILFFSDYKDGGLHTQQAEALANQIATTLSYFEPVKIYLDRYPAQPRASGLVFPEAQQALLSQLNQGAFIAHYVGHGNEYTLQGFEFFPVSVARQLQNQHRYFFFVTATCDWGKWDSPQIRSGGVEVLFLPQRGAIALLTSTRKVFASLNFALSQNFYRELADKVAPGRIVRLGDLMIGTKNRSWGGGMQINTRSYSFLGDPLLPLRTPTYEAVVTQIGSGPPSATNPDTLRPLRAVRLRGEVRDSTGALVSDFEGEVIIRVWDKALSLQTLISRTAFTAQEVLLFSGVASVRGGVFEQTFYLPVDIIPQPGLGRVSLWAQAPDGRAAAGAETRFVICCPDTLPPSLPPPTIRLYLNDTTWVNGSWVDPSPLLLAFLKDSLGINLSPLAIGRELKATLNGQEYFLSTYYRGKKDRPNEGTVEYRFSNLPEGEYRLQMRAYNLAGQEGTAEIHFYVVERGRLKIGRLFNYPNPFTTRTQFFFEHNQPGQPLEARILIYTVSGRLVQTLSAPIQTPSNLSQEIFWDGLDSYGDRLARGVYLYRLELRNPITGETAHAQEKLVLLR